MELVARRHIISCTLAVKSLGTMKPFLKPFLKALHSIQEEVVSSCIWNPASAPATCILFASTNAKVYPKLTCTVLFSTTRDLSHSMHRKRLWELHLLTWTTMLYIHYSDFCGPGLFVRAHSFSCQGNRNTMSWPGGRFSHFGGPRQTRSWGPPHPLFSPHFQSF